jgi:hypothetical protein
MTVIRLISWNNLVDMTCAENLSFTPEQKNILALLDTADLFHWSSCPSCKNIVEKNVSAHRQRVAMSQPPNTHYLPKDGM